MRVHPAPFSPTPNRHAGIRLKMKGGGPGGSRFELVGLLDPQRKEHRKPVSGSVLHPPPGAGDGSGVSVIGWEGRGRCGIPVGFLYHPPPFTL